MAESVPVRCPACRREHAYAVPTYPCSCGAPVTPVLDPAARPESVTHSTWDEGWVTIPCGACGRADQWPRPELGCPCGTVLRVPLTETDGAEGGADPGLGLGDPDSPAAPDDRNGAEDGNGSPPSSPSPSAQPPPAPPQRRRLPAALSLPLPLPRAEPAPRAPFQPVTIRTARDAVTAAALYLRWLGYRDIRRADQRPPSGIGLAARGLLAQVDPTVRPASLRDVECLWLTAMTESAGCVYFSLAGYEKDARACADSLGVPLFVLDLTGTPQAANSLADELVATGA
ncbi:hypothetical protein QF026_002000 [Streptomyces aurantiacus]|uniref:hypothetical protein n=1 Tax=Streptomyces aurantiacus TaxID=47760 RepID=UPI00278D9E92|nr:hypothetical protein [Streptomyces aurantiacus]MDQ0773534.1 hypothetical protein [Streptomyces aurantiacus]